MREAAGRGRPPAWALALLGVGVATLLAVALFGGGGSDGAPRRDAPAPRYAFLSLESPHVASSYPTYAVLPSQEGPRPAITEPLTSAEAFAAPIAAYRRYAEGRLAAARQDAAQLTAALEAGSRDQAERHWRAAYSHYLQLGAVYLTGSLAGLNERINGTPGGLQGGVSNPRFSGLHRIEYGLWSGAAPASLAPVARQLESALAEMAARLPSAALSPSEYSTRAHEILEDAERDQLSGAAVPWSEEGVLGTEAGLTATERVMATLHTLLHSGDSEEAPIGPPVEAELAALRSVLTAIEAAHGGRLPPNPDLTTHETETLQGALGGALQALAQVPATLEAEPAPKPIRIPKKDERLVR
jgi:high-affinity iron transporter